MSSVKNEKPGMLRWTNERIYLCIYKLQIPKIKQILRKIQVPTVDRYQDQGIGIIGIQHTKFTAIGIYL